MPGDRRGQVQAGGQPCGCDPQDGQLRMPGAGEGVGQDVRQRQAVGGLALHLVVGGGGAQQDLHQEQSHHQPEVLAHRAHRRGDLDAQRRVGFGRYQRRFFIAEDGVVPDQQRDAGNHQQDAEDRPHEAAGRGRVAHDRIVREVVGVGNFAAGALGHRGPRGPEEEARHQAPVLGIGDRVLAQGVGLAQRGHFRVVGEHPVVVRGHHFDGPRTLVGNHQRVGVGIVGVGTQVRTDLGLQPGLVIRGQGLVGLTILLAGADIEDRQRLLVQPFG